jgi:hypothetical protein
MKVTSYAVGRPNYYDRNPVPILKQDSVTLTGPASGLTTTVVYTVPAGKKFIMGGMVFYTRVTTALATPGSDFIQNALQVSINGGAYNSLFFITDATTTLNYVRDVSISGGFTLNAGDAIRHYTNSLIVGVGGLQSYLSFNGVEFDA